MTLKLRIRPLIIEAPNFQSEKIKNFKNKEYIKSPQVKNKSQKVLVLEKLNSSIRLVQ